MDLNFKKLLLHYAFMTSDNLSTLFMLKAHNANIYHDMHGRNVLSATFSL